ncbi:MAG: ferrous iron transporter B, partial [Clostridia bacterium]|nr:ferrous iron transporter B [Clostridia bacterium]
KKWLFAGIGLQLAVGYVLAFLVFFFGTLFTGASYGSIWMPIVGWVVTALIVALLVFLVIRADRKMKKEYALK